MPMKFFSIVMVSLNPGEKLNHTLTSVLNQTFADYEVIIKDGGSKDGSLDFIKEAGFLEKHPQIRLVEEKDKSIYDGMNQALTYVQGKYVQFLNCGDLFYNEKVLEKTAAYIKEHEADKAIYYGNQFNLLQKSVVTSAPEINDFTCYRNVPCHQVCFYESSLFAKRAYLPMYTVRADYEHFLYSVYEEKAKAFAMPIIVCSYEGGGYSETKENRRKSDIQHKEITNKYLGKKALLYRIIMIVSMAGLRTKIAESPTFSKPYNALKSMIYKVIKR